MSVPVLTAVSGGWEASLVSGLERGGGEVVVVRRCVDLPELLSAAVTGQARAVVVSADLRRFDGAALSQLASAEVAVVGLVEPGDESAERRLRQLGIAEVLPADAPAEEVAAAVHRAVAAHAARSGSPAAESAAASEAGARSRLTTADELADPARALTRSALAVPVADPAAGDPAEGGPGRSGRLIAVWGPTGAPGRTTLAVTLAAELARLGHRSVLADADTYGGSVAQVLGLLDEAPGLAAAARAADHGTLDLAQLGRVAAAVAPDLRVLTGISAPARWPELRPAALTRVWVVCRLLADWTVVDCGFALEQDEEMLYDTAAPRRNGATLVTLEAADTVIVVGSADPVGLQRLVRGLAELADLLPEVTPIVVVNRVRSSAVGSSPGDRVREALARYAGVPDPVLVPDDRPALDAALLAGRTLTESAHGSAARVAIAELARTLAATSAGPASPADSRRARGSRRSRRARGGAGRRYR